MAFQKKTIDLSCLNNRRWTIVSENKLKQKKKQKCI